MKTPREILLERHQTAAPKLDAIRINVLSAEFLKVGRASSLSPSKETKKSETGKMPVLLLIWHELVFPCRRIWTGLATIWVLIFVVNFSQRDPSELMVKRLPPPSLEMILAFRQQQELLAELIGPNETRAAETPKPLLPQPRSEGRVEILMT